MNEVSRKSKFRFEIHNVFNPFHATSLFLYSLKTSVVPFLNQPKSKELPS